MGAPLSPREREVLARVADWATTAEVAAALGIGPETVKTHLRSIYRKLDVSDRRAAVRAWRAGEGDTPAAGVPPR